MQIGKKPENVNLSDTLLLQIFCQTDFACGQLALQCAKRFTERVLPGGTSYEPISLEQGLSHDPAFENWAALVNNVEGDAAMSLKNFRKDIVINVLNLQGVPAISYKVFRAWVSEYQALPEMDAATMNAVGIQTLTLQQEGWQRDTAVNEPAET